MFHDLEELSFSCQNLKNAVFQMFHDLEELRFCVTRGTLLLDELGFEVFVEHVKDL
jgi:hypothetical protein